VTWIFESLDCCWGADDDCCSFDPTDSYIWLELYSAPSEKDIEIIGSVCS
jgi:hypothetical protein